MKQDIGVLELISFLDGFDAYDLTVSIAMGLYKALCLSSFKY